MRIVDAGETVTVPAAIISRLLQNVFDESARTGDGLSARTLAALEDIADTATGQGTDKGAWILDAEACWWLLHASSALETYGLDECDAATYEHPAAAAECDLQRRLMAEAPRTNDALDLIADAEIHVQIAIEERHE